MLGTQFAPTLIREEWRLPEGRAPEGQGRWRQKAVPEPLGHNIPNPSPTETSCHDPRWSGLAVETAWELGSWEGRGDAGLPFRLRARIGRLGAFYRGKGKPSLGDQTLAVTEKLYLDNRSLFC